MGEGHVFISYAYADRAYVERLVDHLRAEGVDVWCDDQIATGERWDRVLEQQIDTCAAVVAVMSPAARESYWVGVELDHARRRSRPIFPLLLDGEPMFGLGLVRYESVTSGVMPPESFVRRLRESGGPNISAGGTRQVGVVPNAADCFQQRVVAERLDQALSRTGSVVVTQILAGLGGVGKTQLAAAVVRQLVARNAVDDVIWVDASTADSIVSTLAEAEAVLIGGRRAGSDDPTGAARRLLAWLATTVRRWLIVFDDVSEPNDVLPWWPPATPVGRLVVTTRRRDHALVSRGELLPVEQFTTDEARAYLTQKFAATPWRLAESGYLVSDLGCLPVALAQAAAFIADRDLTCAEYRSRFASHPLADLAPATWPDDYARSVAITLSLAVDAADDLDPRGLARPLMTLLAMIDPNGAPGGLIESPPVVAYLGERVGRTVHRSEARDAARCLELLSLVDTAAGAGVDQRQRRIRAHALAQRAARDQAGPELFAAAAGAAADGLLALWPDVERDVGLAKVLRANVLALNVHAEELLWASERHGVLFRVGTSLGDAGQVAAAARYFRALVSTVLRRHGPDHAVTVAARLDLARWQAEAGDPAGAVTDLQTVVQDAGRLLGPDHPDTLAARYLLARSQGVVGDPATAAAVLEDLLVDRLRVLGADHPDTVDTRHEIARWRGQAGDPVGAASAYEEVLADWLRVLGPDHMNTLAARHELANWRGRAGDPAGAVDALSSLLVDGLRVLGPDSPRTLITRHSLAIWRRASGDASGAVAALEELVDDYLRLLGPDHPSALRTRASLARSRIGSPEAVTTELEWLLSEHVRVLGSDHPQTQALREEISARHGTL